MDVAFVNKYTVSKEGHSAFFVEPKRKSPHPSAPAKASPVGGKVRQWNVWIRALGLGLAIVIVFMAVMARTWALAIVGGILVAIYVLRMYQAREMEKEAEAKAVPPPSPEFDASGKWTRYVRFGDHIEKEDPDIKKDYNYGQIIRISDDPAYITLWMDDHTQVRVLKRGFIVGTLDGFKQFIMARTGRLIGPGQGDAEDGAADADMEPEADAPATDADPEREAPATGTGPVADSPAAGPKPEAQGATADTRPKAEADTTDARPEDEASPEPALESPEDHT